MRCMPRRITSSICFLFLAFVAVASLRIPPHGSESNFDNFATEEDEDDEQWDYIEERVCLGTSHHLSVTENKSRHVQLLKERYTNCTHVQGNLELTYIPNNVDLSYLREIREVTGYILIYQVAVDVLPLLNLRIIRGNTLYENKGVSYSLWIASNSGLVKLGLTSLREIMLGNVLFFDNPLLCHANSSVRWDDILTNPKEQTFQTTSYWPTPASCPNCSQNCGQSCWGEQEDECQLLTKVTCASQCMGGRCYGKGAGDCCHPECAGGCTGPRETDCLGCKEFLDDGRCVKQCPNLQTYDPLKRVWKPNPNGKFAYGNTCVKECPNFMLKENGGCVERCGADKMEKHGECLQCDVAGCPRVCKGFSKDLKNLSDPYSVGMITKENLHLFNGCIYVDGSLTILQASFEGIMNFDATYEEQDYHRPIVPADLEMLSTIKEISGYVRIDGSHENMTDLSFLRNLEVIHGRILDERIALMIMKNKHLDHLGLSSLHTIGSGGVKIVENEQLCFASSVNWTNILKTASRIATNRNKADASCIAENQACDVECSPQGCWGPGPASCVSCQNYKFKSSCLKSCGGAPAPGLFSAANQTCQQCDNQCIGCTGKGPKNCIRCLHVQSDGHCVPECQKNAFKSNASICQPCSQHCGGHGCTGPSSTECLSCRRFRDNYNSLNKTLFNCTDGCPVDRPFPETQNTSGVSVLVCTTNDPNAAANKHNRNIIIGSCAGVVVVGAIVTLFWCHYYRNSRKRKLKLMEELMYSYDQEPCSPTDQKPNPSRFRIISEKDLRKGGLLGQGAFGYVYKGVWVPAGESVKIPVAIKILKPESGAVANKEVLEEAKVMATVRHPYLVSLLGICMTSQIMLVTQLMPLGCLLDYVKNSKKQIKSRTFLDWCTQIAKAMKYLEAHHLIHRDLAARNVLVESPKVVKVTDFGLAKMLDINEDVYKAAGGKMPVKWLAPECMDRGIYTHKTDVWAFGITVWELLTYGAKPYENVPVRELPDYLERGERLEQPTICSIDIYMLMLKCWSAVGDNRPSFEELASEFGTMSRDPGRYLMIPGDEFLKLPEYTKEDEQRMMSEFEENGPEQLMTAEEYINPGAYRFDDSTMNKPKRYENGHVQANGGPPGSWQNNSAPAFSTVSAPYSNRTVWPVDRRESPPNSRYAMDPVKRGKYIEPAPPYQKSNGAVRIGSDDYLIPTDHTPPASDSYLDLTDHNLKERDEALVKDYQKMPLVSNRRGQLVPTQEVMYPSLTPHRYNGGALVNNPEYALMSSGASNVSSDSDPYRPASNIRMTSGDESEAEYYNTFDNNREETVPLNQMRRNETTV